MDVHATSILEFFSGEKQCVVPLFQRRYSWGRLQWRTLWEDICTCVEHTKNGSSTPHFLGAVVTMKLTGGMTGVSRSQVIDGQQRLTTISIMLAAMASISEGKDRKRIASYLTNEHEEGDDRLKLLPTSHDQDAYRDVVFGSKELPDHPVASAYAFFHGRLSKNPEMIADLLHVVRERLTVVEIALDGSDDAYLIFESLNHKGQPLTQADLIRNHIMMRFEKVQKSQQHHVYQTHWRPMEQRVREAVKLQSTTGKSKKRMSDDKALTEFFRADMMRLKGDKVVRRRVYDEFRQRFSEMSDHEAIRNEVERLNDASHHAARFHYPALESDPACQEPLVTLEALGQTTPHTLMLELYDQREARGIDPEFVADALRAIESFIVRRLWAQVPTNQLQRLFYGWARMMRDAKPDAPGAWLREQMCAGTKARRWPDDDEFVAALTQHDCYKRRGLKLMLARIEAAYGHKEPAALDAISIEHIIPQTLSGDWKKGLDREQVKALSDRKHFLGNLTLTGYNSELGNQGFEDKCEQYRNSHFEMTKAVALLDTFGVKEVTQRGLELARAAAEVWPWG